MTDARERRRERAEATKTTDVMGTLKKLRVPIVILVLWAAIIGFNVAQAQGLIGDNPNDCPGHWHSTVDYYVNGEKVHFPQGPYQLGGKMAISAHMHGPDDRTWHFEPTSVECIDFRDAAKVVDVNIGSSSIEFDGTQTVTGTFANNETHSWKVYAQEYEEAWQTTTLSKVGGRQLLDGERVVFIYGPNDDNGTAIRDTVEAFTTSVGEGNADDSSMFIAITMTTIFAILALMLWWNFAKKTW